MNAMNLALPPDNDWRHIAKLTGDASWGPENMRKHFMEIENNGYVQEGVPGHGYDGYLAVSFVQHNYRGKKHAKRINIYLPIVEKTEKGVPVLANTSVLLLEHSQQRHLRNHSSRCFFLC